MKKFLIRFQKYLPAVLLVGILMIPGGVFAQEVSDSLKAAAQFASMLINILVFFAVLMIRFGGDLMGTDWITGAEAMRAIQPMWMWVRNLTNIVFVGVLIFLAFSHLFSSLGITGEGGNWIIKEKLPKLIIAIIAINFSLLAFKVVIDAVNVGTVAILGIADHRLEADSDGLKTGLAQTRSWIQMNDTQKTEIETAVSNDGGQTVLISSPESDNVIAGDDCRGLWNEKVALLDECKVGEDGKRKQCALIAEKAGEKYFVCRGFTEQINDLFCKKWSTWKKDEYTQKVEEEDECIFLLEPDQFQSTFTSSSEPGQNLFAAFGTVFMHLERLPALGAEINDLNAIFTNTLFSVIISLAFIVALVAVFIALLARLAVLWISMVFSPFLVGVSIMGIDAGKSGDIMGKVVTHLFMPLKIAAAFAVGFVMMSSMVEVEATLGKQTFIFGPALSQLGTNEYAFVWQIATIVLFWMAAFWALNGSIAETFIGYVKNGAQMVAGATARMLTIDRPLFNVGTGKEFSLGSVLQAPTQFKALQDTRSGTMIRNMTDSWDMNTSDFFKSFKTAEVNSAKDAVRFIQSADSQKEAWNRQKDIVRLFKSSSDEYVRRMGGALESSSSLKDFQEKLQQDTANFGLRGENLTNVFTNSMNYGKSYGGATNVEEGKTETTEEKKNSTAAAAGVTAAGEVVKSEFNNTQIQLGKEGEINHIKYEKENGGFETGSMEEVINKLAAAEKDNVGRGIGEAINAGMALTQKEFEALKKQPEVLKQVLGKTQGAVPILDTGGKLGVNVYKDLSGKEGPEETTTNIVINKGNKEKAVSAEDLKALGDQKALVEKVLASQGRKIEGGESEEKK